jgi:hypothetical protein
LVGVAPTTKIDKELLSLAGEYRVCSELNALGVFATVTYGNRKSVDVYAIGSDRRARALKIEVKTCQSRRFVTLIAQKGSARRFLRSHPGLLKRRGLRGLPRVYEQARNDPDAPDFWVVVQIRRPAEGTRDRFFILTHEEICRAQQESTRAYLERNRPWSDLLKGVDGLSVEHVAQHEDKWLKILNRLTDRRSKGGDR